MRSWFLTLSLVLVMLGVTSAADLNNIPGNTPMYTAAECDAAFQPKDADLTSIAALGTAADKTLYTTAANTWAEASFTSAGRAMVGAANAAAQTALISAMVGDSGAGGTKGSAPAPAAGDAAAGKYLKADGTWAVPPGSLNIDGLTAETAPATADTMPIYDASAAANRKVTLNEMRAYMAAGHCGLRLSINGATGLIMTPRTSLLIEVNGEILDGASLSLTTSDNRITSTGADAGAAMTTSTLYYIYVSNSLASTFPSDLRASTTAPSSIYGSGTAISYLEVNYPDMYLGTTGNAANWRFVGMAYTNGSTQFTDSQTSRLVASYHNRELCALISCPGYNNNNTYDTYTTTSTTWTRANAGTGSRIEWLTFGDRPVHLEAHAMMTNSGAQTDYVGVGLDSTTDCEAQAQSYPGNSTWTTTSVSFESQLTGLGYHYAELMVRTSGGTMTLYVDDARSGAVHDPYITFISAIAHK